MENTYQVNFFLTFGMEEGGVDESMIVHAENNEEAVKKTRLRVRQRGSPGSFHLINVKLLNDLHL